MLAMSLCGLNKIALDYPMRIIGIDIVKGSTAVIHNLKPGWFPFGRYEKPALAKQYKMQDWEKPVEGLYQIYKRMPEVTVCAVVGNNGSGKSTIIDIMFRLINNLAYVWLDERERNKRGLDSLQTGRKLSYAYGLWASLYFETNGNLGCIECNGDQMDYYYQDKKNGAVTHLDHEALHKGTMGPKNFLRKFFYTISCNYSQYAFRRADYLPLTIFPEDKNVNGDWLTGIYHKNDGYLAPLVMTPYREDGLIDFDKENKLSQQRLVVLSVLFYIQNKQFLDGYNPEHIVYSLDLNYRDGRIAALSRTTSLFDAKQLQELLNVFQMTWQAELMNDYDLKKESKLDDIYPEDSQKIETIEGKLKSEFDLTTYYLAYKSLKVCLIYRQYQSMIGLTGLAREAKKGGSHLENKVHEKPFRDKIMKVVKSLVKDESHVALKIQQCLTFYQDKTIDSKGHLIPIENYVASLSGNTYDDILKALPPSYYNVDVTMKPAKEANRRLAKKDLLPNVNDVYKKGELRFSQMSSGERQLMNSLSYIIYHIKNLQSVKNGPHTVAYRHINIVFDEAELYAHPNFQRDFVTKLLETIHWCHIDRRKIKSINIILATHSPFVLSDVLSQRSLYLENGELFPIKGQSFGGNYYDLLENSFFFKESAMGRISTQRIEEWIKDYERGFRNEGYLAIDMTDYIGDPIVCEYMNSAMLKRKKDKDV